MSWEISNVTGEISNVTGEISNVTGEISNVTGEVPGEIPDEIIESVDLSAMYAAVAQWRARQS